MLAWLSMVPSSEGERTPQTTVPLFPAFVLLLMPAPSLSPQEKEREEEGTIGLYVLQREECPLTQGRGTFPLCKLYVEAKKLNQFKKIFVES